jgi:hypothetical protein
MYILLRPEGGLNDILCQIDLVLRYAKKYKRKVLVDTAYEHTNGFNDSFSRYFTSKTDILCLDANKYINLMQKSTVYPLFIRGRLNKYTCHFQCGVSNYVDDLTGLPIGFDFKNKYKEEVLVHHASGGGQGSLGAISCLRLNSDIIKIIKLRLSEIGGRYTGIHIRNTDYKTDWYDQIQSIRGVLKPPYYVATDDPSTLIEIKKELGEKNVFSYTRYPDYNNGVPLHLKGSGLDVYDKNIDAILDLIMLSLSFRLYVFNLYDKCQGSEGMMPKYSGYSQLALNLWQFRYKNITVQEFLKNPYKSIRYINTLDKMFSSMFLPY